MSELGETFKAMREHGKAKRQSNSEFSIEALKRHGVEFEMLNPHGPHLRVGEIDFWPSTGLFINRRTQKRSRGIHNLLTKLGITPDWSKR